MFMGPRHWFQGMNSASLCSLAGRYENPIPPPCLASIDFLKIPAQVAISRLSCWGGGGGPTKSSGGGCRLKGGVRLDGKYHHDWMYARKWPSQVYVYSIVCGCLCTDLWSARLPSRMCLWLVMLTSSVSVRGCAARIYMKRKIKGKSLSKSDLLKRIFWIYINLYFVDVSKC